MRSTRSESYLFFFVVVLSITTAISCVDRSNSTDPSKSSDDTLPTADSRKTDRQWKSEPNQFESLAESAVSTAKRFTLLDPEKTGVAFTNPIDISHPLKRLYHSGFVCGGIAIGDVDGDRLPDIFLTSGPRGNRLYRQVEDISFEDVTEKAGVHGSDKWGAGAAMADIDNDGDVDIYVCNYDSPNQLFVNNGQGVFDEAATDFGLDLIDASLMPAFCDYDRDGDLDVYVLTNRYYRAGGRPRQPPFAMRNGKPYVLKEFQKFYGLIPKGGDRYEMEPVGRRDHLLRNNGDGTFSEISEQAGIVEPGHGLSITWWDYNHDGWPDAYVGNDFDDPDHLYRNNGDGTFTDELKSAIPHTSWFSMGADFGDLNNDGLFDLLIADMSATTHYSQKTTMGAMNATKLAAVSGPPPQIMKNALFVNSGTNRFFEAAELAGLADSDWTWAIKLADFDNDGRNDVFISNGMARNFNHSDHSHSTNDLIGRTEWDIYEDQPPRPEQNLAYRNKGNLQFEDVSLKWGIDQVSMSFATAYADFDRDGDLDLVVANLDESVSIYRNDVNNGNSLMVALRGTSSNRYGIGATVTIEANAGSQIRMLSPQTGFLSSNQPILHFGIGDDPIVKQVKVQWPGGQSQTLSDVDANQLVTIHEPSEGRSGSFANNELVPRKPAWFHQTELGIEIRHTESVYDDFATQPLLPNKLSQLGPGIAVADCDGDGDDDFFVGGAIGQSGRLIINLGNGRFDIGSENAFVSRKGCEDMGAIWFDADSDGDNDLFVVSGGVEAELGSALYQDRLYLNDGSGTLGLAPNGTVPDIRDSGSCVCAVDFDKDGDLDLFVGSRVIPGEYPISPKSRLLRNDDGKFLDVTQESAPSLLTAGLVTGGVWSDADDDGWIDLMLSTEWGPVRFLRNEHGKLVEKTEEAGLAGRTGWWNGIAARDLDNDGDIDYVATNFGLNTKYHASEDQPIELYYGDFDGTGKKQLVEAEYENKTLFPIRGKSCSTHAMPHLGDKFSTYHEFALAPLNDIYGTKCLAESNKFSINTLESVALTNDGNGYFRFQPLPRLAQISPGFGIVLTEVDGDGNTDIYLAQNFFNAQPETGRMDGGMSLLLLGNGDGSFRPVPPSQSGLIAIGDATAAVECYLGSDQTGDLLVAQNDGHLLAFENKFHDSGNSSIAGRITQIELRGQAGNLHAIGSRVSVTLTDGSSQTAEVIAGQGYLAQSSPVLSFAIPANCEIAQIDIRWPDGTESLHDPTESLRQLISQ